MNSRRKFQIICSVLLGPVILTALVVIAGWLIHSPVLIQLHPSFPPMTNNTAVAILLAATGLLAANWDHPRLAAGLGAALAALAGATLLQYAFHIDSSVLDELFIRDLVQSRPAHPGRMAPNTAGCLTALGVGLALSRASFRPPVAMFQGALALIVMALSGVALLGYFTAIHEAYTWGTFTGMAVHTALCLLIISGVALAKAWGWRLTAGAPSSMAAPLAIGMVVAIPALVIWYTLWQQEDRVVRGATALVINQVADRIKNQLNARQREAMYVASALAADQADPASAKTRWWPQDPYPGQRGLAVVDPSFALRWLDGSDAALAPGSPPLARDPVVRRVIVAARDAGKAVVSDPVRLKRGRIGFVLCIPLFDGQRYDHAILALYDARELFDRSLNPTDIAAGYGLTILHQGRPVYARDHEPLTPYSAPFMRKWARPEQSPWEVRVWPVEAVAQLQSILPEACLIAGLVMAVLTSLAAYHRQNALRHLADLDRANAELTDLSRTLDGRVAQRTAELAQTNDELEAANGEMESFVYSVSHDLKSPIVTCRGFLGLLEEQLRRGDAAAVGDSITRLQRSLTNMGRRIDSLLELSRIGRVASTPETIDMNALLASLADDLAQRFAQRGVTLCVEPGLPALKANRNRVAEAFENLLTNALKYGCSGPHPEVVIGGSVTDDNVVFRVADNGPGIQPEYHQKIFQLFQRLDRTQEGSGIGLTIVSRIMAVHAGSVWVESSPGRGAAFYLAFPRNPAEARPIAKAA